MESEAAELLEAPDVDNLLGVERGVSDAVCRNIGLSEKVSVVVNVRRQADDHFSVKLEALVSRVRGQNVWIDGGEISLGRDDSRCEIREVFPYEGAYAWRVVHEDGAPCRVQMKVFSARK